MNRYVVFLRGINISGKNKVSMVDLKSNLEKIGFLDVKTLLNSGNVLFSTDEGNINDITVKIETMIEEIFKISIPIYIIKKEILLDILNNCPSWWGNDNKQIYDNLIFIIPPTTFIEVYDEIKEPKEGLERIQNYNNIVYWSFSLKDYKKSNWWVRTASSSISNRLTIRTANTIKKIVRMD